MEVFFFPTTIPHILRSHSSNGPVVARIRAKHHMTNDKLFTEIHARSMKFLFKWINDANRVFWQRNHDFICPTLICKPQTETFTNSFKILGQPPKEPETACIGEKRLPAFLWACTKTALVLPDMFNTSSSVFSMVSTNFHCLPNGWENRGPSLGAS